MIKGIRIKNLRSIVDSGEIRLRKINVLVGKNSAGKSTLLRVLPLLRQSVERGTKGPILWYGRLVDFGEFQNAVNSRKPHKGVSIEFKMSLPGARNFTYATDPSSLFGEYRQTPFFDTLDNVKVLLEIGRGPDDEIGLARRVLADFGDDQVELLFDSAGAISVRLNGQAVEIPSGRLWLHQPGKLLPIPSLAMRQRVDREGRAFLAYDSETLEARLVELIRPLFHGNTNSQKIGQVAGSLLYASERKFYAQLKNYPGLGSTFTQHIGNLAPGNDFLRAVRGQVLLRSISDVFRRLDSEIFGLASSVRYVEPIRATAERYYRQQDLAVDEIDSSGENTAMFLSSLTPHETDLLQRWMSEKLGFYAFTEQGGGHTQVKIRFTASEEPGKNIADLGFGYSQLLPIILQLWRSVVRPARRQTVRRESSVLAIEQPELHLHPQFQAQIADVFVAALGSTEPEANNHLFVETHSEHIVNRLGYLIATGHISRDDVQILVVDTTGDSKSVSPVTFDAEGYLDEGWPLGFFVPEIEQ